ncbi:hypothetical protein F5Y15DRAFT_425645 [Xylariaceae sp. FL0016]|nr:hypothetical protein F5Y15DRAFT_425645 [Xylariaceae sp. FL0016]
MAPDGCQKDKCNKSAVGKVLSTSKTDKPWCKEHCCTDPECEDPRASADGKGCAKHTCHAFDCNVFVTGYQGPGYVGASRLDDYCPAHRTCLKAACREPVFTSTRNAALRYCFRHFCDAGATCEEPRLPGAEARACKDHTCDYVGCRDAMASPGNVLARYCKEHTCKRDLCIRGKRPGADWCDLHACQAPQLKNQACEKERDAQNQWFCKDHYQCSEQDCQKTAETKNGIFQLKCAEHEKRSCFVPACQMRVRDEQSPCCANHMCFHYGCLLPNMMGVSFFCQMHKCSEPTCGNLRAGSAQAPMAQPMMLGLGGKNNPMQMAMMAGMMGTSGALGGGTMRTYCGTHGCQVPSCTQRVVDVMGTKTCLYCVHHKCRENECVREATDAGYCQEHDDGGGLDWDDGGRGGGTGGMRMGRGYYPRLQW